MRRLIHSSRIWFYSLAAGGTAFVLEGCDPNVRDTVLGGVEGATTSLISTFIAAFFQSLAAEEDTTVTTVKVLIENSAALFA
ncbi:MAG: hypothetical protein HRF50_15220 [Phycisphaerae bacterium]|jgi:hypothetical protein